MHQLVRKFQRWLILLLVILTIRPAGAIIFPTQTILYDHVVTFPKGTTVYSIPLALEKNTIYSIALESYVPYASFEVDIYLQSPEHTFQFWTDNETLDPLLKPIYRMSVQFGIATTTNYTLKFFMTTAILFNLHIRVCRETTLKTYYSMVELQPIENETALMDIATYNSATPTHHYDVPIQNDTVMWMNFFQVSPVSEKVTNAPEITITLQLKNLTYTLIPGLIYEGYGLPSSEEIVNVSSHYYRIRFGSSISGTGQITVSQTRISGNAVNFAFIWFHAAPIGNGSDTTFPPPPPPANDTETNHTTTNTTTTTTTTPPPSWTETSPPLSFNDRMDAFFTTVGNSISRFFTQNFYLVFGIGAGLLGMVYIIRQYAAQKKPKYIPTKETRPPLT